MGTRIHIFIEYDRNQVAIPFSAAGDVVSFSLAELFLANDYALFDALAGGRNHVLGVMNKAPLFPPRGLPPYLSQQVYYRYYHVIDDPEYPDLPYDQLSSWVLPLPPVTHAIATEWMEQGAKLAPIENHFLGRPRRRRIANPNWHCPSWLSVQEIELSLRHHSISEEELQSDMAAVLATMRSIEVRLGVSRTRIVFWFSN